MSVLVIVVRWANIFHGVNARIFTDIGYAQGDYYTVLAWPSAEWLDMVGLDADYIPSEEDVSDLINWARGDVYYVERQYKVTYTNDADPSDTITKWERDVDEPLGIYFTDAPENITDYNL